MKNNDLKPYGTYLNMLAHKYDKGQVFEDFLQIIVCCLQMGRAEELYFKTIKKYSRDELQYFSLAFASLVDEMTRKELQDPFYGWFEQNLLNAGSGQFFTPRPVADLLAQLEYIPTVDKADKTDNDKRIYDPCCGSGGLILACAKKDRNRYFVAADISYTCCLMTLVNMCLYSLSGEVLHMDSLSSDTCWHRWLVIVDSFTKLPTIYEVTDNTPTPHESSADLQPMKLQGNIQPVKDMTPQIQFVRFGAR